MYTLSAPIYDAIYRAMGKDYAAESAEIRDMVRSRAPEARTLLDVACGTGAHLAHLAEWFEVVGVDSSVEMLEEARKRAPDAELLHADMADLNLGREFDAVT
jgi:ubiquinone/menaquinone biosynthesis C-methylase UbiE